MVLSSSLSLAAPGDFIHTGLERYYNVKDKSGRDALLRDLKDSSIPKEDFYREVEGAKYVNVVEEETEHGKVLDAFLIDNEIEPADIIDYLQNPDNLGAIEALNDDLETKTNYIAKSIDVGDYGDDISDPLKLVHKVNYSTPEPGEKDGTTQFAMLKSFNASTKWIYKVSESLPQTPRANEVVVGGTVYLQAREINVEENDFIILYATDLSDKVKGYVIVKVTDAMVKKPRVKAEYLDNEGITVSPGTKVANAIIVNGLLTEDLEYFVRKGKLVTIYEDSEFVTKTFESGEDILMVDDSNYVYFIHRDEDGKIVSYHEIEVKEDDLSKLPDELKGVNYTGPVHGNNYESTMFTHLSGYDNWMYSIGKDLSIPIANSKLGHSFESYKANDNIIGEIGDNLILAAVDSNANILAYETFTLDESNISGSEALKFDIEPKKGKEPGTTMVKELILPDGASKWMYAVGENMLNPYIDRLYEGSNNYSLGNDITGKSGETLYILATDNLGRVKAYGVDTLDDNMIKDPLSDEIKESYHYTKPIKKGSKIGTSQFSNLNYKDKDLYSVVSNSPIDIPEKNSDISKLDNPQLITDDIKIFDEDDPKLRDEDGFTMYMMIYAVEGEKIIASTHKNFDITPDNVKLPDAGDLPEHLYIIPGENILNPGNTPNSTILNKLDKVPNLSYYFKFIDEEYIPELNEIVKLINRLEPGKELTPAIPGEKLLILLVDSKNRTKEYAVVDLNTTNTRGGNAPFLVLGKNYSNPVAGTVFESTTFKDLSLKDIKNATKFMIKTSEDRINSAQLNKKLDGAEDYASFDDDGKIIYDPSDGNISPVDSINNRYLILLATNDEGEVKAYQNFTLTENNIHGPKAEELSSSSFTIGKGTTPGTIRFDSLSNFGIVNRDWMYKWINDDEFLEFNTPYVGQIIDGSDYIITRNMGNGLFEGTQDVKVGEGGYILLLATNGRNVLGYRIIPAADYEIQSTATLLNLQLEPGSNADSTRVIGDDLDKAKKYMISTREMPSPAPNEDLPGSGVKDVPVDTKEITIKIGEYLRIYDVDDDNRIIGFVDFSPIKSTDVQQGKATLSVEDSIHNSETNTYEVLEGSIRSKLLMIKIELEGAQWADANNSEFKNLIVNGLKADGVEQGEWSKVLQMIKDDKYSVSKSGQTLTIRLPATENYDISDEQRIRLEIPVKAIVGAINPISDIKGEILIKPTIGATISGSIVNNINQNGINSGTATIRIDLVDGRWIDNLLIHGNIVKLLGGFVSPDPKWSDISSKIEDDNITLTSTTSVQITIPENTIEVLSPVTITLTIDEDLVEGSDSPIPASPSFTIYPNVLPVKASVKDGKLVELEAPDFRSALVEDDNIWIVDLEGTNLKEGFTVAKDLSITNLPPGLKLDIKKESNTQLSIKLIGKASSKLSGGSINLFIKSSAIEEINYSDSKVISLDYGQREPVDLKDVAYKIDSNGIHLDLDSYTEEGEKNKLEYRISYNGSNDDWTDVSLIALASPIYTKLEPITIQIREKAQPNNKRDLVLISPNAPDEVLISSYQYNTDDNELKVTLNKTLELEYNLGTPDVWVPVTTGIIPLEYDSKLVVRTISKDNSLPTKPTPQLNGLFLGDVKLDVSQSKIMGATTSMEYSLNSDADGKGGSWNPVKTANPTITFFKDNIVWIREKNNNINMRNLGTVDQVALPVINTVTEIDYDILGKTFTNKTTYDLQFRIANGPWIKLDKKVDTVDGLAKDVIFSPGLVEIRGVGLPNQLPSSTIIVGEITLPVDPPELRFDNDTKTIKYLNSGVFEDLDILFEYKLGATGDWRNGGNLLTDEGRKADVTVFVKKKPTKSTVASKEVSFKFTKDISFANVDYHVANGLVSGTTNSMEYSVSGNDGPWTLANNGNTTVKFVPGMNLYIREKGKPSTTKALVLNVQRESEPILDDVSFNVLNDLVQNNSNQNLEFRIAGGEWIRLDANSIKIPAGLKAGKVEFRKAGTKNKLESQILSKPSPLDIIMSEGAAPVVEYSDTLNKIISIHTKESGDWTNFEYRINSNSSNAWSNGEHLSTEDLSGDKNVEIRIKADSSTLPSKISLIKFTNNLELGLVILSEYTNPYQLNGTTSDMEYKVIYLDGNEVGWKKALKDTTPLVGVTNDIEIAQVILRDGRVGHQDNQRKVLDNAASAPSGVSIVSYDYTGIEVDGEYSVSLKGVFNTMEYKLDGDAWTPISSVTIGGLNSLSDLRVRVRSKVIDGKSIPASITTPKLNGRYLGDVALGNNKLIGTDASMEYSLDGGSSWTPALDGQTPVDIEVGNVIWIRQFDNNINLRNLGTVTRANKPDDLSEVDYSIINRKIVGAEGLDYRINGGPWISINGSSATEVEFIAGKLEFRTSAIGLVLESQPALKSTIPAPAPGPNVRFTGQSIEYYDGVWKEINYATFDYKVGSNGSWKSATNFKDDETKNGNVILFVRKAATNNALPSKESSASDTFANVKVNVVLGLIENTEATMEYSFDFDHSENSSWNKVNSNNTSISFVEGMEIWIREANNPNNYVKLVDKLAQEATPNLTDLEFNIINETITNTTGSNLEYRIKADNWKKLAAHATIPMEFKEGVLEFRKVATAERLASKIVERFVIGSKSSGPVVIHDDSANKIVSIDGTSSNWKGYQYRIGTSGNWLPAELLLNDIDLSGNKTVQIRIKAGVKTLASQITSVSFTENIKLELRHVTFSEHKKPFELNGTTDEMEYKVNDVDHWESCVTGNTKLKDKDGKALTEIGALQKITIRDKHEHDNEVIVYQQP